MSCYILCFLTLPFSIFFCLKVVNEYEKAVLYRFGRSYEKNAGLHIILPCIDRLIKIDQRIIVFQLEKLQIQTQDFFEFNLDSGNFILVNT